MHVYNFKQEKELIIYTGRHDDPPTADEGLRGPALVLVKDLKVRRCALKPAIVDEF